MARMGHEYQAFEQAAGSARYRGIFIVDLTRENFVATDKRSQYFQLPRQNNQVCVCSNCQTAFPFKTNRACGIFGRHCECLVQWYFDLVHHRLYEIDHARRAARERRAISQQTNAPVDDAIITEKRKPGSIRQARASSCVSHKTNSRTAFCAVQHFHQRCRNMITVRNQFAENGWFTQCELKQARDTINATSARRRHAIKYMAHAAHSLRQSCPCVVGPRIAVAAAYADLLRVKPFDRFQRPPQLRSDRDTFDHVSMFQ